MCFACGQESDTTLVGMKRSNAQKTVNALDRLYFDPYVWRVEDGFLVIGTDDSDTVRSVARFSKEGELTKEINMTALKDADPSQWVGRSTQELYAQLGQPHYEHSAALYRQTVSYLTEKGKICYIYLLDDRVSHVRVYDLFSDETALYPSGRVQLEQGAPVTLISSRGEPGVEVQLSAAEAEQILAIFNGKERYSDIPAELMCGFYDYFAFRIGDRLYCPALDGCCDAMEYDTGLLFDLSQEERDTIDTICAAHGVQFP